MFRRVLVALDLSPASEALVTGLPGLEEYGVKEIILAHVARPVTYPVSEAIASTDQVRSRLGSLAETLAENGFDVEVTVANGAPSAKLIHEATERGADAIVVGSRGRSRIQEAFVGSVAWDVVRRAPIPVLIQRIEPRRTDPEAALTIRSTGLPSRVLHPTDFSEISERALVRVEAAMDLGVEEVTLLHVYPEKSDEARKEAKVLLDSLGERLERKGTGAKVNTILRAGSPAEEILATGGNDAGTLVIMGTHGRGFLPEMVMGSESRQVVRRATGPVVLVPGAKEAAGDD
ncbi:MAG: universal stress protein [Gemmatimonadales bacterium]|nr:MAG: universal stress protein [Gemmatimonadales bacterium]